MKGWEGVPNLGGDPGPEYGPGALLYDTTALQQILGTDDRNPSFTLYRNDSQEYLHVYYGLELLEVVPNDREHSAYKLLVARLYNARIRVGVLEEVVLLSVVTEF